VDVDLESRPGHPDWSADAILLVDDEVLRQHVEDLTSARQGHRFRRIDRTPHVLARDLAVLSRDRNDAAAVEGLDVRARKAEMHGVDLDSRRQFRLVDGLLDRVDGRLEVDHHPPPDALRLRQSDADDVEPSIIGHLADDSGDL